MRDFFHGVGKILTGPEGPAHDAIDNARDGTQEEDDSHDGLHHRGLEAGNVASRVTEEGIFRDQGSKKTHQQEDEHEEATAKERFSWGVMGSWRLRKHRYPRQGGRPCGTTVR